MTAPVASGRSAKQVGSGCEGRWQHRTLIRLLVSRENIFHGNGNRRRFSGRISERVSLRRRRQLLGDPACLSVAEAANRTQHSCGLWRPSLGRPSGCAREPALVGPDTPTFPTPRPFKKRLAHSAKGVSRSARLAAGADRPGEYSCSGRVAVWRGSGGRWDGLRPSPLLTGTASR